MTNYACSEKGAMKPREYIHTLMNVHKESVSLRITQLTGKLNNMIWFLIEIWDDWADDFFLFVFFLTWLQNNFNSESATIF